jgi:protein-disulfide isomerase
VVGHGAPTTQGGSLSDATRDKVLTFIRERFGVPPGVTLTMGPLHPSSLAPSFDEAPVMVDQGTKKNVQPILISKDARFLVVLRPNGTIELQQGQDSPAVMAQRVQEALKVPANLKVAVGGFKRSASPDFQTGTLTITGGPNNQEQPLLLTRDGKYLLVDELYSLGVDLREQALRTISLRDQPSQGPADAPVTIAEYADLECPTCARVHEFLETQVVPRYGNKVRIVFKEYPLPMHDWSMTAAIACECAYDINPASFVPLRTAIFRNQQLINVANVRQVVLNYGEEAGLNRVTLAGCVDSKASYPRIQRDVAEAKRLDVNQTPTLFFNGKMIVGLPSEDAYFQLIDELLRSNK